MPLGSLYAYLTLCSIVLLTAHQVSNTAFCFALRILLTTCQHSTSSSPITLAEPLLCLSQSVPSQMQSEFAIPMNDSGGQYLLSIPFGSGANEPLNPRP